MSSPTNTMATVGMTVAIVSIPGLESGH